MLFYAIITYNTPQVKETVPCNRCGSLLVQTAKTVEQTAHSQSPVTTVTYTCTNKECQAAFEQRMKELAAKRAEQEKHELARAMAAAEKKAQKAEALAAEKEEPDEEDLAEVEEEVK